MIRYELTDDGRAAAASDPVTDEPQGVIPPALHELIYALATNYRQAREIIGCNFPALRREAKQVLGLD